MKNKFQKKTIVIVAIIILLIFGAYQLFRQEEPVFDLFEVTKGDVAEELWETGRVQRGERLNLSFKTAGEIEKLYITANQAVERGELLAKLDTRDLDLQIREAQLALELAGLNLEKLLAGASPEEIQIAQTRVKSANLLLDDSKKNLQNSYATAVTVLNASYPQFDESLDFIRDLIKDYVVIYDQDARVIVRARDEISREKQKVKTYWDIARKPGADSQDIEKALSAMKDSLEEVFEKLENVRLIIEDSFIYKDRVSAADKALLNTLMAAINSSLAEVISSQQTISARKASLETARANLQEVKDALALTKAEVRQVDIALYETQIKQAQSKVEFYENQLERAFLRSPIKGQISSINKREGERVTALEPVISLSPAVPFEISADIYEEDIVKVKEGDSVEINLLAFPEETFPGTVVFIDDSESIIDGVVHYEIKIAFDHDPPEGIRATMTADIVVQTQKIENVLIIPRGVVPRGVRKATVEVLTDDLIQEREIEIGLRGEDNIEVVSGLKEGDMVVIR